MELSDEDVAALAERNLYRLHHLEGFNIWDMISTLAAEVQRLRAENAELRKGPAKTETTASPNLSYFTCPRCGGLIDASLPHECF